MAEGRSRKKIKVTRRRGGQKLPDGEKQAPPPPPEAPEPPRDPISEWTDIAERAARKLRDFATQATGDDVKKMAVDASEGLEKAFEKVREQARDLMAKGQHTRVRIKFRGKQLVELPIAVVAAAEVASFAWFGPLRVVIGHVVGKAMLDVEFVSNADAFVQQGKSLLADGELEKAEAEFDKALEMDRRHSAALLGKGIVHKLRGDRKSAREWFEKAESADPRGETGREARRHLDNL